MSVPLAGFDMLLQQDILKIEDPVGNDHISCLNSVLNLDPLAGLPAGYNRGEHESVRTLNEHAPRFIHHRQRGCRNGKCLCAFDGERHFHELVRFETSIFVYNVEADSYCAGFFVRDRGDIAEGRRDCLSAFWRDSSLISFLESSRQFNWQVCEDPDSTRIDHLE